MGGFKDYLAEMAQNPHKAGYQFHMIPDDSGCGVHTVVATHPSAHKTSAWRNLGSDLRNKLPEGVRDQVVGTADIQHDDRAILGYPEGLKDKPHDLYVDSDHRRKGVASGMYDAYEKHTGRPVKPSTIQTPEAKGLWKDRRKKIVSEAQHHAGKHVGKWGTITHDGKRIEGSTDETASDHDHIMPRGDHYWHGVDYLQDHSNDTLNIRTHTKMGLETAMANWMSLPHMRSGMITHDHLPKPKAGERFSSNQSSFTGKAHQVLSKIKELSAQEHGPEWRPKR